MAEPWVIDSALREIRMVGCGRRRVLVNELGLMAMDHWRVARPTSYQRIPQDERQAFFTDLGEEAQQKLESTAITLAGEDPPQETPQERTDRLNRARLQARDQVLDQMILTCEDPSMLANEPSWEDVESEWKTLPGPQGPGPSPH